MRARVRRGREKSRYAAAGVTEKGARALMAQVPRIPCAEAEAGHGSGRERENGGEKFTKPCGRPATRLPASAVVASAARLRRGIDCGSVLDTAPSS